MTSPGPLLSTFTDGVSLAHPGLIKKCAREVGYNVECSAVQVRLGGGIKGVLCAANPDTSAKMDANEVWVRDSQKKFESPSRTLNIVKVSLPERCY